MVPARAIQENRSTPGILTERSNIGNVLKGIGGLRRQKGTTEVSQSLTEGSSYHLGLGDKGKVRTNKRALQSWDPGP